MRSFKIKHDFPKVLLIHCFIILHCLHTSIGQEDLDTSYLLRSGGGLPGEGMSVGNVSNGLKVDIDNEFSFETTSKIVMKKR